MLPWKIYEFFRSSHRSCFMKKTVLKNFAIFTEKLQACSFIKNRIQHRCFPPNIAKFWRTSARWAAASVLSLTKSNNLWTCYEQLSYQEFDRNLQRQPPELFSEKGVLRNFIKLTVKDLCQSLFFNKVAGLWHRCFPCEFCEISKNNFLQDTSGRLLLNLSIYVSLAKDWSILH